MRRTLSLIASVIICPYLISCSGTSNGSSGTPPPTTSSVTVAPATVSLNKGGSRTFTATVNGTMDQSVFWEIVEARSEEHTSELQSQSNLVCRLLLEKKTKRTST